MYYDSYHINYANQEVDWLGCDSLSLYNHNLKVKYQDLQDNGWINGPRISYKFNQQGFRSEQFTQTSGVVFLGCSFVMGVGVPYHQTWASIVARQLNMPCLNLGQAGGSGDSSFRLGQHWIPKLNPKIVIYSVPPKNRLETITDTGFKRYLPNKPENFDTFYKSWLLNEDNGQLNSLKNLYALRQLCKNIKFFSFEFLSRTDTFVDYARDLTHSGTQSNINVANFVLSQL